MYIYEVIEKADSLYPNSFTDSEKLGWINEVGATIKNKYKKSYITINADIQNGEIILPEDIKTERIKRIYIMGIAIEKESILSKGEKKKIRIQSELSKIADSAEFVYQEEYEPVANIQEEMTICSVPYDSMYLHYLIAMYCFFMRDIEGYNQYISAYNQLLNDYARYLKNGAEIDTGAKIRGWF